MILADIYDRQATDPVYVTLSLQTINLLFGIQVG